MPVDWKELRHAYGSAWEVPEILARLLEDPSDDDWAELWNLVCHQGSVYSASYPTLPFLAKIAEKQISESRLSPVCLAGAICIGSRDDPNSPLEEYRDTVDRLLAMALETLADSELSQDGCIHLLQATLALEGDHVWGTQLDRLDGGEFEGDCPGCGAYHMIAIGEYGFFATTEEWVGRSGFRSHPVEPAALDELSALGKRLFEFAAVAGHTTIADWLRYLFGSFVCLECEKRFPVADAIDRSVNPTS